jgi:hypothetical protein
MANKEGGKADKVSSKKWHKTTQDKDIEEDEARMPDDPHKHSNSKPRKYVLP